jgi:hypothetical protein
MVGEIIACMKAWLFAGDHARQTSFPDMIVFDRQQASEMKEYNAHEVMRRAERDYPAYTWEMVKIPSRNLFVVEETKN